jgi:hypothetical protein
MSTRIFTKFGWSYDTDCRLTKSPQGIGLTISPPLVPLAPYYRETGPSHPGRAGQRGCFRPSYLGKAIRWLKRRMARQAKLTPRSC